MRESVSKVKEYELAKVELQDLKTVNETLKTKLGEAHESLKSNENLITYLNKQLNEKQGGGPGPSLSTMSSVGAPSKPPLSFKPSFTNVE